jgi:hypothetical protein
MDNLRTQKLPNLQETLIEQRRSESPVTLSTEKRHFFLTV